ncbi:hypothetical protein ElyMa_005048500 [Elysia marginata]|uniref:C-type lectin domain-containing protein n=1 Tax=Elysia marginata TaxID=1093978 RepID=A0AAV4JCN1_9GAST|nr:hypothetical protein ElyMa_005048500 [Elysia marginata]
MYLGRHNVLLYDSLKFLRDKCVANFYDSLEPSDRAILESHIFDTAPDIPRNLCSKVNHIPYRLLEETETKCVLKASKFLTRTAKRWVGGSDLGYNNYKAWLKIWLIVMGDKYTSVRETCYGMRACPSWSMKGVDGTSCFTVHQQQSYDTAREECQKGGGDLVNVDDISTLRVLSGKTKSS